MNSSRLSSIPNARHVAAGLGMIILAIVSIACERSVSVTPPPAPPASFDSSANTATIPVPLDSALRFPDVPDPVRTPGAALDVTAADICVPGYSKRVRNVPVEVKREAYALYGVMSHEPGEYEVDHLISLELGGSNSIRNLWPESFRTHPWNAYVKDALENELHRRVCAGTIDLAKAQYVISHNWVIGYRIYVRPEPTSTSSHRKGRHRQRREPAAPHAQFDSPVP